MNALMFDVERTKYSRSIGSFLDEDCGVLRVKTTSVVRVNHSSEGAG